MATKPNEPKMVKIKLPKSKEQKEDVFVSVNFRTYIRDNDSCIVLRVEMPEPERPLLCRAVYLCYGTKGGYELYVTSELAEDGSYYICVWSDQGAHYNFGDAPADPNDEMDMAAELFWRSIDYGRKTESQGLCSSQS